ncbi:MAG: hypothetical protein CME70_11580 [Halobacteriovorax sp.]|nr:hypothetical protein [Halobacteriovorax sp.]|tara:strand:- start:42861 stop:43940 length:1080 start_codon:yes stop_codon:yes gene_type:complete
MKSLFLVSLIVSMFGLSAQARVYKNVKVGEYKSVIDLNDYIGQPFFDVMRDVIYPELNEQALNRTGGKHLDGIKKGEGVEVILGKDVTTYHVKYKADHEDKVERSGRSFGAVGYGSIKKYVADASYKHYLRTLERVLRGSDEEVEAFYSAIIKLITDSDPTELAQLETKSKQVASDFVAIYIAEQYRRLTATQGEYLGRSHRWDDALMQVTLVAAFHSGQDQMQMFYEGEFTGEVYNQNACLYKAPGKEEERANTEKREARLYDYWQFTVRSECPGRSGVNLTRRDFEKLGRALTDHLGSSIKELDLGAAYDKNFFKAATKDLLTGTFEYEAKDFSSILVDTIMQVRAEANLISEELSN